MPIEEIDPETSEEVEQEVCELHEVSEEDWEAGLAAIEDAATKALEWAAAASVEGLGS